MRGSDDVCTGSSTTLALGVHLTTVTPIVLSFAHTSSGRLLLSKTAPRLECAAARLAASSPNFTAVRSICLRSTSMGVVSNTGKPCAYFVFSEGCAETRQRPTQTPTESTLRFRTPSWPCLNKHLFHVYRDTHVGFPYMRRMHLAGNNRVAPFNIILSSHDKKQR